MAYFLCFIYIFAFPLGKLPMIDSSWVIIPIAALAYGFSPSFRKEFCRVIGHKFILRIIGVIFFTSLYAIFITTLLGANDYSFVTTLIHQLVSLVIGILVVTFLIVNHNHIAECLVVTFFIQGCIQLFAMFSPAFRMLTNIFRTEGAINVGQRVYTGIRGLAISGYAFFGLAVAYGVVYIIWAINYDDIFVNMKMIWKICILAIMVFGGVSAGRTSIIGLIMAIGIFLVSKKRKIRISLRMIFNLFIFGGGLFLILFIIQKSGILKVKQVGYLGMYVFELLRKGYTTSGNELFDEMYFKVGFETLFLGDGYYTTPAGYYMNTDAGYMRVILYMGIPGLILLFVIQNLYFNKTTKKNKKNSIILLLYILIVQIKGEVLGFLIICEAILLLYYFYLEEFSKEKGRE